MRRPAVSTIRASPPTSCTSRSGPEPADVLKKIATSASTADALDSFHPPHAGYKALRAKLAEARKTPDGAPQQRIPGGPDTEIQQGQEG